MDAENTVDTWTDVETQNPQYTVRIPQRNHDQHTDGNLQVYTAEISNQIWIYLSHPCPHHKIIINLSGIKQPPPSAIQACTTSQTPRHHRLRLYPRNPNVNHQSQKALVKQTPNEEKKSSPISLYKDIHRIQLIARRKKPDATESTQNSPVALSRNRLSGNEA